MTRVMCHVSCVMRHVSCVMCYVSDVMCQMSSVTIILIFIVILIFFGQSGGASQWLSMGLTPPCLQKQVWNQISHGLEVHLV